jgi:solute carrier family 66 (lysosomal lysine-arginine transporter), member 1
VLDYLCYHCYTNTARAFARESTIRHLDADGDEIHPGKESIHNTVMVASEAMFKDLDLRERCICGFLNARIILLTSCLEIRVHILSGCVDEATRMLNEHFPSVLSGPVIESPPPPSEGLTSQTMDYTPSTSIDPAHLTLNLRILSFIEACRTIPLVHSPLANEAEPSTLPSSPTDLSPERQLTLLSQMKKLYLLISGLADQSDRAVYLKELKNVGGLLAYKVPETSSISKYLSQERREAVADQINSAILST